MNKTDQKTYVDFPCF